MLYRSDQIIYGMKSRTFIILIAAAFLILGASGCAEKTEPDPAGLGEDNVTPEIVVPEGKDGNEQITEAENGSERITQGIKVSSRAFEHNASIPKKYTCDGENLNPSLEFSDVPEEAKSLVLILEDPDAPGGTFTHWLVWGLDPASGIEEDRVTGKEGMNDFGKPGYGGPCPPPGTPHRYFFRVYALDTELVLEAGASRAELEAAMTGHVLSEGKLMGRYGRA